MEEVIGPEGQVLVMGTIGRGMVPYVMYQSMITNGFSSACSHKCAE